MSGRRDPRTIPAPDPPAARPAARRPILANQPRHRTSRARRGCLACRRRAGRQPYQTRTRPKINCAHLDGRCQFSGSPAALQWFESTHEHANLFVDRNRGDIGPAAWRARAPAIASWPRTLPSAKDQKSQIRRAKLAATAGRMRLAARQQIQQFLVDQRQPVAR